MIGLIQLEVYRLFHFSYPYLSYLYKPIKNPFIFTHQVKERVCRILGTSIIYSPSYVPSLRDVIGLFISISLTIFLFTKKI